MRTSTEYMYGYSLAVHPANPNLVYAAGYNSLFFKSTNAGSTWTLMNSGLTNAYYIYDIAPNPANQNIIYLASSNGVFKTTNAGTTWTNCGLTSVNDLLVHPFGPDTIYAGTSTGFYKSVNAGATWTANNAGLLDTYVTALAMKPSGRADSSFLFAGTKGGGMHRMFINIIPVAEDKTRGSRIGLTVGPNPVRGRACFQYTLPQNSRVRIAVYDAQGRRVDTVVDGQEQAGTHCVDWDCRSQAVGVYFVQTVADQSTEVGKLILMR